MPGRLFFRVPGGITYGQHWLNVKFPKSLIRVPFRILTEEEEKMLSKNYKDISRQVKDAFKPPEEVMSAPREAALSSDGEVNHGRLCRRLG